MSRVLIPFMQRYVLYITSNKERPMYVCMLLSTADRLCWAARGLNAAALNSREFFKNGASNVELFL